MLRNLDRRNSEAALAAVDEEGLAPLDFTDDLEVEIRRSIDFGNASSLPEIEALRHRHDHSLRHYDALGISAAAEKHAYSVADLESSASRALKHFARAFESRPKRPPLGRSVDALPLHKVCAVHCTGLHRDLYVELVMADGLRHVLPYKALAFVNAHCLHVAFSPLSPFQSN